MFSQVIHTGNHSDNLRELGSSFHTPLLGNSFFINDQRMQGNSRKIELEPGLWLQSWDIEMLEDGQFTRAVSDSIGEPLFFQQYFTSPQCGHLLINNQPYTLINLDKLNALLSWDVPVVLNFKKSDHIKCITLIFSKAWLVDQLGECQGIEYALPTWVSERRPVFFPHKTSVTEQLLINELFHLVQNSLSLFQIKADLFCLLDNKLKLIEGNIQFTRNRIHGEQLVIQLEKKIMASLTSTMPNIHDLAKEFYTSPSTLKRHFKSFFGENIYEYYLHKKMKLARHLLTTSNLRVSEVANNLGYDSVSHFVSIFKKIYKLSPRQIRKNAYPGQQNRVA